MPSIETTTCDQQPLANKAADKLYKYPNRLRTREAQLIGLRRGAIVKAPAPASANQPSGPASAVSPEQPKDSASAPSTDQQKDSESAASAEQQKDPASAADLLLPDDTVGLALSGGGLRSATFCLGVIQALAARKRLPKIDFMSTVSGGGYIGGFLGRFYTRQKKGENAANNEEVCRILKDCNSDQINWLRDNANYLCGLGSSQVRDNLAILWRNLLSVHIVMGVLVMSVVCALHYVGYHLIMNVPQIIENRLKLKSSYDIIDAALAALLHAKGPCLSEWYWLPVALLCVFVLPLSITFWLLPYSKRSWPMPRVTMFAWLFLIASVQYAANAFTVDQVLVLFVQVVLAMAAVWQFARADLTTLPIVSQGNILRNRATKLLGTSMLVWVLSVLWVLIDSVACTLESNDKTKVVGTIFVALAPCLPLFRSFTANLKKVTDQPRSGQPATLFAEWTAGIAGVSLATFLLVVCDTFVHAVFDQKEPHGGALPTALAHWQISPFAWLFITSTAFTCIIAQASKFLNLSTFHGRYAAQLGRTFLGASNTERLNSGGVSLDIDVAHPLDDMPYQEYHPEEFGGPLHLFNVCVNETVDVASHRDVRERKGLSMCLGPAGISVGRRFHALWKTPAVVESLPAGNGIFHVLARSDPKPVSVETLQLSQWIAISGAAVSTGLGRATSLPVSFLAGLLNIRLGYWWDSGIKMKERPGVCKQNWMAKAIEVPMHIFHMQWVLLDEWRALFRGPSYRFWYLTDGGHFENTAIYELVRRRVPFIIAVDGGEDPRYSFGDLALVTRLIRLDFGATIKWIDPDVLCPPNSWSRMSGPAKKAVPEWITKWVNPAQIGKQSDIRRNDCPQSAALARISYEGESGDSWLLLIKASLCGDESVDLREFAQTDPTFPNDSTENQFFDGAQWECYRLLGEQIGKKVFAQ